MEEEWSIGNLPETKKNHGKEETLDENTKGQKEQNEQKRIGRVDSFVTRPRRSGNHIKLKQIRTIEQRRHLMGIRRARYALCNKVEEDWWLGNPYHGKSKPRSEDPKDANTKGEEREPNEVFTLSSRKWLRWRQSIVGTFF